MARTSMNLTQVAAQRDEQSAARIANEIDREVRWRELEEERAAAAEERARARNLTCGAKTRKGTPCQRKLLLRGGKCPNHGGMSTGPKTKADASG